MKAAGIANTAPAPRIAMAVKASVDVTLQSVSRNRKTRAASAPSAEPIAYALHGMSGLRVGFACDCGDRLHSGIRFKAPD